MKSDEDVKVEILLPVFSIRIGVLYGSLLVSKEVINLIAEIV